MPAAMKLYGIPNCDTVKKARAWLTQHGQTAEFHDFKKQGVTQALLENWMQQTDWEKLVNRQGTTWRQLPEQVKAGITNKTAAIALMLEKSSIIKRPVLEKNGRLYFGFDEELYRSIMLD